MNDLWERLENALQRHAPSIHAGLRPPASEGQIEEAERILGVRLPDDVRGAYRWHDGCSSGPSIFVDMGQWCSLERMVDHWTTMVRVSKRDREQNPDNYPAPSPEWKDFKVKPVWWNKRWIPIGVSSTPSSNYIDLDPAPAGTSGQLISDAGMIDARVMAPSLDHFFQSLAKHLEEGRLAESSNGTWGEVKPRIPAWWNNFDWSR